MAEILVIGAHPDDAEIGMGGTILALQRAGHRVTILDLTDGEPTPRGTPELRRQESAEAAAVLGVGRVTLDLPNRYLQDTIEARRRVAEVIRLRRPELIFAPYWQDAHPDHVAASAIADAARFYAKLTKTDLAGGPFYPRRVYYYFCTHLRLVVVPSFVYAFTEEELERKVQAVERYRSQFAERPDGLHIGEAIRVAARWWGAQVRRPCGEPFLSREPLGLEGLEGVI